jgi:hypothetical protein
LKNNSATLQIIRKTSLQSKTTQMHITDTRRISNFTLESLGPPKTLQALFLQQYHLSDDEVMMHTNVANFWASRNQTVSF